MSEESKNTFKSSDELMKKLLANPNEELMKLVQAQNKQPGMGGALDQSKMEGLNKLLSQKNNSMLSLDKLLKSKPADHDAALESTETPPPVPETQSEFQAEISASSSKIGPYHTTLRDDNGTIFYEGPPSTLYLTVSAYGSGPGWFESGTSMAAMYADYWFYYPIGEPRFYAHTFSLPMYGKYLIDADDSWYTSEEATLRIGIYVQGLQNLYWWPSSYLPIVNIHATNIYEYGRLDGVKSVNYVDFLVPGRAYLKATARFYCFAQGGGTKAFAYLGGDHIAELNHLGVPTLEIYY